MSKELTPTLCRTEVVRPGDPFEQVLTPGLSAVQTRPDIEDLMLNWSIERVADAYVELHPEVNKDVLLELLTGKLNYTHYGGIDLIYTTNNRTKRNEFLVIETNGLSGLQETIHPSLRLHERQLRSSFFSTEKDWLMKKEEGGLAYVYGEYIMDTPNFPHFMAEISGENVYVVPLSSRYCKDARRLGHVIEGNEPLVKFVDGVMFIKYQEEWLPIRACFWKQGQQPWSSAPVKTKTFMYPPAISHIAGGENKLLAHKAYELFNEKYANSGLQIRVPKTVTVVGKGEIPAALASEFPSKRAIIKIPYDTHGYGVFVVRNEKDISDFAQAHFSTYNLYTVQELIDAEPEDKDIPTDNYSFVGYEGPNAYRLAYHFRLILCDNSLDTSGFKLLGLVGMRSVKPFRVHSKYASGVIVGNNRDLYVTNMGPHMYDRVKLLYPDEDSMLRMGLNLSDIIDGFVQSIFALHAIDAMCSKLLRTNNEGGGLQELDWDLLKALNPDPQYLSEIMMCQGIDS